MFSDIKPLKNQNRILNKIENHIFFNIKWDDVDVCVII